MTELRDLFGEPTERLVQETVFWFKDNEGEWPTWEEAAQELADWKDIPPDEAERRIAEAVRRGEVLPRLGDENAWTLALDEATEARIERRLLAVRLTRNQHWEESP